jgi:hypothetical protein
MFPSNAAIYQHPIADPSVRDRSDGAGYCGQGGEESDTLMTSVPGAGGGEKAAEPGATIDAISMSLNPPSEYSFDAQAFELGATGTV